jgi:MtN3 and saliva related transmembrane protein
MNYLTYIGLIAGFLTSSSFIPQVIKVLRDKETEGLSLSMYVIYLTGLSLWIVYSVLIKDITLLIANAVTFILAFPILVIAIKHKKQVLM